MAYGGQGVYIGLNGQPTDIISLKAGTAFNIPPGTFLLGIGPYSTLQVRDPVTTQFLPEGPTGPGLRYISSDGTNYRVVNYSGCPIGAIVTTAGSGYSTSAPPTVTSSAGGSLWTPIIGGAISTTISITNGGSNYTYPPIVQIAAPSQGPNPSPTGPGFCATATCALTSGAVSSITVVNQGAGYTVAPQVTFINDARDTTGSGAVGATSLTGAGTITGLVVTDFGAPQTSVPTLTFSSGSGAATVIMDWTVTSATLTNAGSGYVHSSFVNITSTGGLVAGSSVLTNPYSTTGLFVPRKADIHIATDSSGILQTGQIVVDGGRFQATPVLKIIDEMIIAGPVTTAAVLTPVMGGVTDQLFLFLNPK